MAAQFSTLIFMSANIPPYRHPTSPWKKSDTAACLDGCMLCEMLRRSRRGGGAAHTRVRNMCTLCNVFRINKRLLRGESQTSFSQRCPAPSSSLFSSSLCGNVRTNRLVFEEHCVPLTLPTSLTIYPTSPPYSQVTVGLTFDFDLPFVAGMFPASCQVTLCRSLDLL